MVEFTSYLVRIGWMSNMSLISWYRDVWCRYFHGMNYDEYVEYEEKPKTYVDVNGNEYDTSKHDFMKDWIVRERKVENKLREEARRNREEARRNKATFGDELREMAKESQNRISDKAATEAQIIFDVISKDFIKQSQAGYSSVHYNDKEFEDIMTNNHIANSTHVWKELKKICERNKIHVYLDYRIYPITYYYCFEWK